MELATPITIHWDFPDGTPDTALMLRICDDIVQCRPLMLQLQVPDPQAIDGVVAVLARLKGKGIAVSLTTSPATLGLALGTPLQDFGLKEILLAVEHVADLKAAASLQGIGVSFSVDKDNWRELPALITFCREEGIGRLVLPMQRLYRGETPFHLNRGEQDELAGSLSGIGGAGELNLTIHDPFLWRAFNPGVPFPQCGCQAANTMIAIAPDGIVYPCPTLPVKLGEIGELSLKAIIASPAKKEYRRRLLESPADCRDCAEVAICRGGCRGRAYVNQHTLDGIDIACA